LVEIVGGEFFAVSLPVSAKGRQRIAHRDSYEATIMPLPRCQIPILTVAGLIQIAALQPLSPTRVSTGSSPTPPSIIALLHMTDLPIVGVQRGHAHDLAVEASWTD